MKKYIAVGMLGFAWVSSASALTISIGSSPNTVIPELGVGLVTPLSVSGVPAGASFIYDVNVRLNIGAAPIAGNSVWNGDLYAQLTHVDGLGNSAMSVLLNRVGRGQGGLYDAAGYGPNGFNITLDDQAAQDVHWSGTPGGQLGGAWQADGRLLDPSAAPGLFPGDPRGGRLSNFNGMDANGDWYLYLYDAAGGNVAQISQWGLDIDVREAVQVPEGSPGGLGFCLVLFGSLLAAGRRWSQVHAN
jgi:hypothetical protein